MIKDYLEAGYPALCVLTQEPHRAEELLPFNDKWNFIAWDCMRGIRNPIDNRVMDEIRDPVEALNWLGGMPNTVMIAHNLHLFMELPEVIQAVLNGVDVWKRIGSTLVMVSPIIQMRTEIEKFFHVIDLNLPNDDELFGIQVTLGKEYNVKPNRKASRSARGLTKFEAETAYALSLTKCGYFSTRVISEAKQQMIHKSGLMQFWEPAAIQDVGGLGLLKSFIENRSKAYDPDNEDLPRMKGLLLVGIPGTGKSLSSKATASISPCVRIVVTAPAGPGRWRP